MELAKVVEYLKNYDGRPLKLMEVCGTHTSSIFKNGIRSLISPKIKLISGPGCPVCVTPAAYIDKCIEYAQKEKHSVLTFGDMIKVPGTAGSFADNKGNNVDVQVMYSPFEAIEKAKANSETVYAVAAVGFETTAPAYALMLQEAQKSGIKNIKLITALKTVIPALEWICRNQRDIDGFICPGHVSVIIGSDAYKALAQKYNKPFVVAGFEGEHILAVIYDIVRQIETGSNEVRNYYTNAVKPEGNIKALEIIGKYFETHGAVWRGLGSIENSGLYLREEYMEYDGGSFGLDEDIILPAACRCGDVIVGRINPDECSMFATGCTPVNPYGPCMVSAEGACGIWYRNRR